MYSNSVREYTVFVSTVVKPLLQYLKDFPVKQFSAGDMILYQGEVPSTAYVVKTGLVRTYNISSEGDEKPISFWGPSDILSIPWVFDKSPSTMHFFEAHTDCAVYAIRRNELMKILRTDHKLSLDILDRYATLLTANTLQLDALECSRASDKVLHMLFYLCQAHGITQKDGTVCIDIPLTQQDLANLLGLTRETTGIELLKLKRTGLISLSKKRYFVKKDTLLKLIGENEFENLSL